MISGFRRDAAGFYIEKDPDSVLDYVVDWTDWLNGDTISTADFTVAAGLTRNSQSNTTKTATVWLSGGTVGQSVDVRCRITTAGGRTDDRTFRVIVRQK